MPARDPQVVLLCGGFGTRIRDVSEEIPKAMIPIGGQPILWHIMKSYAHFGFRRFVLCLGYKGWIVKRFFLDYLHANSDLTLHLQSPEEVQIHGPSLHDDWEVTMAETGLDAMTGCRVKRIEKYIDCDDFMLTYGDGLADLDLGELWKFHLRHGKIGTMTSVSPPGRFGELELSGDRIVDFSEKPARPNTRINGGFMAFHRRMFDRLQNDAKLVFEQAPLMSLAHDGELMTMRHDGFWRCMDNSRDYQYLNDVWQAGNPPWRVWAPTKVRVAA